MTSADIYDFMRKKAFHRPDKLVGKLADKLAIKLAQSAAMMLMLVMLSYGAGVSGIALAHASDHPEDEVEFAANEVSVNREEGILIATGDVVLKQMGQILNADKIIYNQTTDIALATGNVVLTMPDGTLIRSEQMELDENFTHLVASPVIALYEDGSRFFSRDRRAHRRYSRRI